ncbi:hypothetical protein JCM15765_30720 [Paradesulfitobacterium aromaticivorans]
MKKFMCMGLVVLMIVFSVVPAYAADGTNNVKTQGLMTPLFTYIWTLDAGLTIDSSGKAACVGNVTLYNNSYSTDLTVQLQKSTSNGWSAIKTWTASGTGVAGTEIVEYYYVTTGTYRVSATAKVYDASGMLLETESLYSATVTY